MQWDSDAALQSLIMNDGITPASPMGKFATYVEDLHFLTPQPYISLAQSTSLNL